MIGFFSPVDRAARTSRPGRWALDLTWSVMAVRKHSGHWRFKSALDFAQPSLPCIDFKFSGRKTSRTNWMKSRIAVSIGVLGVFGFTARGAETVDFTRNIKPILEVQCVNCHGGEKPKGKLSLETRANAIKGGEKGTALVPGKPDGSPMFTSTVLPPDHDDAMPPKGERLAKSQTDLLKSWIEQGANWPEGTTLKAVKKIDFV